jgi:hypothetical protein
MSPTDRDYAEKRNFIRMFIEADVDLTDPSTGKTFKGEGKDISGDGVSIITQQEFTMNQKLAVNIQAKQSTLAPLSAELEIKRVIKLDDGSFEVAGSIAKVN